MLSMKFVCRHVPKVPDIKFLICREVHKNYYDALGLTPKATQADIKNAYYKMSMIYHPDKGADNSGKFQEISTAYEVLGNNKLRKLYDKGLLPKGATQYAEAQEQARASRSAEPESREFSSRSQNNRNEQQQRHYNNFTDNVYGNQFEEKSQKKGPYTGRTDQYDFDAWTKAHYSETFTKQQFGRAQRNRRKKMTDLERLQRIDKIATGIFVILVLWVIYIQHWLHHGQDRVDYYRPARKNDS